MSLLRSEPAKRISFMSAVVQSEGSVPDQMKNRDAIDAACYTCLWTTHQTTLISLIDESPKTISVFLTKKPISEEDCYVGNLADWRKKS